MLKAIKKFSELQAHTNVYGIARSLFAMSTLLTLIFNKSYVLFPVIKNEPIFFTYNGTFLKSINLFVLFGENLIIAKIIAIVILIFVLIGLYPRYTVILHWWVTSSFLLTCSAIEGGDQLIAIVTLLFIPIGLADKRKWHWSTSSRLIKNPYLSIVINSFFIVIKLQICFLYLQASFGKIAVEEWVNGTVLYYWFEDNIFGLNDHFKNIILPLFSNYFIVSVVTYSVLVFEILLAFTLVMEESKKKMFLYLGMFFHFMIWMVHGLPTFFITMTGALILYIIPFYKPINFKKNETATLFLVNKLKIFIDTWCPNCVRFGKIVQKLDFFDCIELKSARNLVDQKNIEARKAIQTMIAIDKNNRVFYGFSSIYQIIKRLPLMWVIIPIFWVFKISGFGNYFYRELAVKRRIIPLHCDRDCKDINSA